MIEQQFLSIPEIGKLLGFGRTKAYEIVKDGTFPTPMRFKGKRRDIKRYPVREVMAWINQRRDREVTL